MIAGARLLYMCLFAHIVRWQQAVQLAKVG